MAKRRYTYYDYCNHKKHYTKGKIGQITKYYFNEIYKGCVICSSGKLLSLHHIVPFAFRSHFYIMTNGILRTIDLHDILPVCEKCHERYEKKSEKFIIKLFEENNIDYISKLNIELCKIRSYMYNIKHGPRGHKYDYESNADYEEKMLNNVKKYLIEPIQKSDYDMITNNNLIINMSKELIYKYKFLPDLQKFVEKWRQHFLENTEPKYLPKGWRVNRSILNEMAIPKNKNKSKSKSKRIKL